MAVIDYHAESPLPADDISVGRLVSVPDWREGTVIGWTNGTVTEVRGTSIDPTGAYIVRLDSTGEETIYFGYSIAEHKPHSSGNPRGESND